MANAGHAPAPPGSRVAVYGATGHTGRFVVAELLRRGFTPVSVARDQGKLAASGFRGHGVEGRAASIDEPPSSIPRRRGLRDNQAGAAARTASASSRTAARIAGRGSWP
jgi:uncharacterized protein YbjT (DUF2867 family)